jgi:hypothetical protein
MGNVYASHDPVIAADPGDTATLHGPAAKGAQLTNGIVIADDQLGVFTSIFLILWLFTDRCELKNMIVFSNRCAAGQNRVRSNPGARINPYLRVDD